MIFLLLLFLLVIPFLIGQPVRKILDHTGRDMITTYLLGILMLFITSGGVQLLMILTKHPFSDYKKLYLLILAILSLIGFVFAVFELRKENNEQDLRNRLLKFLKSWFLTKDSRFYGALTAVVLALCAVRILTGTPDLTGDFTLETMNTTLAADSIYEYNSLTGQVIEEGMPIRQQILTLPVFLAFLSRVFGIDAAKLLYKIFPCYVLILTVLVYSRWGGFFFPKQAGRQMGFLFIVSFLLLVGDYGRFAPSALLLHQGFTGNAVCAGVVIPFAIYLCMRKKWLPALLCAGAELFLIWTTYGLGFCVFIILLFGLICLANFIGSFISRRRK